MAEILKTRLSYRVYAILAVNPDDPSDFYGNVITQNGHFWARGYSELVRFAGESVHDRFGRKIPSRQTTWNFISTKMIGWAPNGYVLKVVNASSAKSLYKFDISRVVHDKKLGEKVAFYSRNARIVYCPDGCRLDVTVDSFKSWPKVEYFSLGRKKGMYKIVPLSASSSIGDKRAARRREAQMAEDNKKRASKARENDRKLKARKAERRALKGKTH